MYNNLTFLSNPVSSQEGFDLLPSPSALSRAGAQPLRLSLLHLGILDPSARSLIAYMSGASLKKGSGLQKVIFLDILEIFVGAMLL